MNKCKPKPVFSLDRFCCTYLSIFAIKFAARHWLPKVRRPEIGSEKNQNHKYVHVKVQICIFSHSATFLKHTMTLVTAELSIQDLVSDTKYKVYKPTKKYIFTKTMLTRTVSHEPNTQSTIPLTS